MLTGIIHTAHLYLRPVLVALFYPNIPFYLRWRTLLLQPTVFITYTLETFPYWFSSPFHVEYLPVWRDRTVRALVFKEPGTGKGRKLRPLHIEIHGGAFMGGTAEGMAPFDHRVAKETGAVVVSITYRFAPEHVFPAAIDDVDDTIAWIKQNAERKWGADAALMTVSGASSGANLALASTQQPANQPPSETAPKAIVTFDAAIDLRLTPADKPRPEGFPRSEPLKVLYPLFDAYVTPARAANMHNPRLHPALAKPETLPERISMIIAGMDIVKHEQEVFAKRINEQNGSERVETMVMDGMMHGYMEREFSNGVPRLTNIC